MSGAAAPTTAGGIRTRVERRPARRVGARPGEDATVLIRHRVGGGSPDEPGVTTADPAAQADGLTDVQDRFHDHDRAWSLPRERRLPFTIHLASGHTGHLLSGYVGGAMRREGTAAPVRRAELYGRPVPERAHARIVVTAKAVGARG
ncbi:hypothetical protein ACWEQL_22020 [Kitasatospora sp. NPDC004240]